MLIRETPFDDSIREDGVRRSDTGGDGERFEEGETSDEEEDEAGTDEPRAEHDGEEEHGEGAPFSTEVGGGEVNTGEEDLDSDDDPRDLEGQRQASVLVAVDPAPGREPVKADRSNRCQKERVSEAF